MPYVWLALTGLIVFLGMARIGRFETKVALLFLTGSLIAVSDLIVILFRLYEFRPGLLALHVPDARLGMFLADGLFVPLFVSAMVGAIPRRRWIVSFLLVVPILFIENEFSAAHLYTHIRWKLWHSAVLFPIYLSIISAWADRFERDGYSVRNRAVLTLTSLYYTWTWYTVLTSGVLNLYTLRSHLMSDLILDHVLSGVLLRFLPFGAVGMLWVWNRWVEHPAYIALLATVFTAWFLALTALGIYRTRAPWHPLYASASATLLVLLCGAVDRWFAGNRSRVRL